MTWLKRLLTTLAVLSCAAVAAFFLLGPRWVDSASNQVVGRPRPPPHARGAGASPPADCWRLTRRFCSVGQESSGA